MTLPAAPRLPRRVWPALRSDEYLCPLCRAPQLRYQLRQDENGVPRRVDVSGSLCYRCNLQYRLGEDDGNDV